MDKRWVGVVALFFIFGGGYWVLRPMAAAIAKRIAGDHRQGADAQERDATAAELQQLRQDLTELQERVDFTERLLAKQRDVQKIGPGGQ